MVKQKESREKTNEQINELLNLVFREIDSAVSRAESKVTSNRNPYRYNEGYMRENVRANNFKNYYDYIEGYLSNSLYSFFRDIDQFHELSDDRKEQIKYYVILSSFYHNRSFVSDRPIKPIIKLCNFLELIFNLLTGVTYKLEKPLEILNVYKKLFLEYSELVEGLSIENESVQLIRSNNKSRLLSIFSKSKLKKQEERVKFRAKLLGSIVLTLKKNMMAANPDFNISAILKSKHDYIDRVNKLTRDLSILKKALTILYSEDQNSETIIDALSGRQELLDLRLNEHLNITQIDIISSVVFPLSGSLSLSSKNLKGAINIATPVQGALTINKDKK